MTVYPLADHAASLRHKTLRLLRTSHGLELVDRIFDTGQPLTMPAQWSALPRHQQIRKILRAEDRRVAGGTTFAVDTHVVGAIKEIAQNRQLPLPFTEDLLPSPSGMLVSEVPMCDLARGWTMSTVTWGPPMEGFGPGVHLTWWGTPPEGVLGEWGAVPHVQDFDLHLPFAPIFDVRLVHAEVPSGSLYSHIPLRTVIASWYALSSTAVEIAEQQPQPSVSRALVSQKAKRRGVQVATVATSQALVEAITSSSADRFTALREEHGIEETGGLRPVTPTPRSVSYGVFEPAQDDGLLPELRYVATRYRAAAEQWHRLESGISQTYPGLFSRLEELRAREHGEWPSWCWMPSLRVSARLMNWYDVPAKQAMWEGPRIAAVGAYLSGGRHALLGERELPPLLPTDAAPVGLEERMPVRGLGLIIRNGEEARHLLAFVDYYEDKPSGELTFVSDENAPAGGFRDLTKFTLFLTGSTLTAATRATQEYYDWASVQNGQKPPPWDDSGCVEHATLLGSYLAPLAAACAPGAIAVDVAGLTGRTEATSWPPEPGLLAETKLWLVAIPQPC